MQRQVTGLPALYEEGLDAMSITSSPSQRRKVTTPQEWVGRELEYYEDHYTKMEPSKFTFITFNIAEKKPCDLKFMIQKRDGSPDDPNIICIGLQELDMSAAALMKEETEAATPWLNALAEAIGADYERNADRNAYLPIASKQLVGLFIVVFAKKSIEPSIKHLAIGQLATGALGAVGNKGAVGVRFNLNWTSLCLLNCHLAAHQGHVDKRNQDIDQILRDCSFALPPSKAAPEGVVMYPRDHDVIIVIGDLNYRVDIPYEHAVSLANSRQIGDLLKADQLVVEMRNPHSPWQGFVDCKPSWPPTYRYDKGTNDYDTSEKKRIPSFTDRVLYWSRDTRHKGFEVLEQHAVQSCLLSDHKPVRISANVPIQTLDRDARSKMNTQLHQTVKDHGLDKVMVARTTVSVSTLDFGTCCYQSEIRREFVIENTGLSVAECHVLRRGGMDPSLAQWLRVQPLSCRVFPGEKKTIAVSCRIDRAAVSWLGRISPFEEVPCKIDDGTFRLSSFLAVFVTDGPTHFVECQTILSPSCFGSSLENLIRMGNLPCRTAYVKGSSSSSASHEEQQPQLPKEIWLMVDWLYRHGLKSPQLFVEEGEEKEIAQLRTFLDGQPVGIPPDFASAHSVAQCLLLFLRDLQEPVIPKSLYFSVLAAGKQGGKVPYGTLNQLPPLHCNVLVYIVSFMRYLLRPLNAQRNGLTEEVVAPLLCGCFFRHEDVPLSSDDQHRHSAGGGGASGDVGTPSGSTTGTPSYADPNGNPSFSMSTSRRILDMRAELAARKADSISFISALLRDDF